MSAAYPWALAAFAALPLLWWWHRARRRPRDVEWPSLLLWKRLPVPDPAAVARHRRRADAALWLAMAGVVVFAVGAAKLKFRTLAPEPIRVGVVVDATASARGAFREIAAEAGSFVRGLPGDAVVDLALVPFGEWRGLAKAEALDRLSKAGWTDAPGDVAGAAARFAGDDVVAAFGSHPGPAEVATWRVHTGGADTHAVEALFVADGELFAVVRGESVRVTVRVGEESESVELTSSPGGRALLRRPAGAAKTASVEIERPDGFESNNARFWAASSEGAPVGISGRDFPALRRALEGAGLKPELGGSPSIWIGVVPAAAPRGAAVIIDPPKGVAGLFEVEGEITPAETRIPDLTEPLVKVAAAADLSKLQVSRARKLRFLKPPVMLVDSLIYLCDGTVVVAFDPSAPNSNWPRLVSFPLFWADVARRFRPSAGNMISTGDSLPDRHGPKPFFRAGLFLHNGAPVAVNLEDARELAEAASPASPASPRLDLPTKNVILSERTVPPAGGALAGLALLILSWLAARPRRR
ncbi:MAG: BatA domain-containing protein [Planctomycetota bacterium]